LNKEILEKLDDEDWEISTKKHRRYGPIKLDENEIKKHADNERNFYNNRQSNTTIKEINE
jgi:hypothetical protein